MTLGDIFAQAARKDLSAEGKALPLKESPFLYSEFCKEGRFEIRLSSTIDENAYIETSIPYDGLETTQNYCRVQFLAMVFKAAMAGMQRRKERPNEAPAPWIAKIFEYCQAKRISPIALIQFHKKFEDSHKDLKQDE